MPKQSQLPDMTSPLDGTETLSGVQSGVAEKATTDQIREYSQIAIVTDKVADFVIVADEAEIYAVTTGGTDRTGTLPLLSAATEGTEYEIVKVDSGVGTLTVDENASDTDSIQGVSSVVLVTQYNRIRVRHMGTFWAVVELQAHYSTGWTGPISDWTNAEVAVAHGLDVDLSDLVVDVFLADDASGTNGAALSNNRSNTGGNDWGNVLLAVSDSQFKFQTATLGFEHITDSGGSIQIDTETRHIKVNVYRLRVGA